MGVAVAMRRSTELARPLRELVPLIKEEIEAGNQAGIEHYRRAGEMLLEAKAQVPHGEWGAWIERNFHLGRSTASDYMKLATATTHKQITGAPVISSIREAIGRSGGGKVSWQQPVQQVVSRVNVEALARERQAHEREQQMLRQLANQLIDIGYKVLAAKLHPDKGGSAEAMARLNKVRKLLKEAL